MSAVAETAVIFLGVNSLAWPGLIAAGRLRTPGQTRRPSAPRSTVGAVGSTPAASAGTTVLTLAPAPPAEAEVSQPAASAATTVKAVARSTRNPGLAEFAASRPRGPKGQFVPLGRAS